MEKKVVIMGGGPAGLAAGYFLSGKGIDTEVLEKESQVGGISKTICYKNNYFDLGGHRFFTKLDEVNNLWNEVLDDDFRRTPRLSRIFYNNKFFNYPLKPANALFGVGIFSTFAIIVSYIKAKLFPRKPEKTFEDWVSNRFGYKLYSIFFKTYTEKVWGIPCDRIGAEWAAQRIKGLSLFTAIKNAVFGNKDNNVKTLIDEFMYPRLGPGMMYNAMSERIKENGGQVHLNREVVRIKRDGYRIVGIVYRDTDGTEREVQGTDFISSIPITELIEKLDPPADGSVRNAAANLRYRSFITVVLIINREKLFPDNWIYIHSPEVKLGRIQNFKNWSPDMVSDPGKTVLGLEYFCTEGDELWNMKDEDLFELAKEEISRIKICNKEDIEDWTLVRVPKSYPVYMLGYKEHLDVIEKYLKKFENLQLVGRYGLFKYNNMDHSVLTGLYAAKNIVYGTSYDTWKVNTDEEYYEEKREMQEAPDEENGEGVPVNLKKGFLPFMKFMNK